MKARFGGLEIKRKLIGIVASVMILMSMLTMSLSTALVSAEIPRFVGGVNASVTRLVIGVDRAKPNGYGALRDVTIRDGGKIVNTVSLKGEVIALVVRYRLEWHHSLQLG